MQKDSEYSRRQYNQIIYAIDDYEHGTIGLGRLIANLEALLATLGDLPPGWRDAFLSRRGVLDDVYAFALDEGRNKLDDGERRLIAEALGALRRLVHELQGSEVD